MGLKDSSDRGDTADDLLAYSEQLCEERLQAYRAAPHDAEEHANIEKSVLAGGYAYRQVAELVQNAADAVAEAGTAGGRIEIVVDDAGLWAANTGTPIDRSGVKALLNTHASGKRSGQIGRFGLGFKSLLKLGGRISVLSRTVSLHFDPERCRKAIREELGLLPNSPAPGLRLAKASSWVQGLRQLPDAQQFSWAATIIFAELITGGAREGVLEEMRRFPAEFLLFLPEDVELVLSGPELSRRLRRRTHADGTVVIDDLAGEARPSQSWRIFHKDVSISDTAALLDATDVHARDTVPVIWAAPIGGAREVAGRFYAFFPTTTETRTLGILNAPWKLNSDRTSVIPGAWNAALMVAAADLIAERLSELITHDDPGIALDAFPRELQHLNEPAAPLVQALWTRLLSVPALPNCSGELTYPHLLRRAPLEVPELIRMWSELVSTEARNTHLHATCASSVPRLGRLRQLAERMAQAGTAKDLPNLRQTPPIEWLELAGSTDPAGAVAAINLAEMWSISSSWLSWEQMRDRVRIILAEDGTLNTAPSVTLSRSSTGAVKTVHGMLLADPDAKNTLRSKFNVADNRQEDWKRLLGARIRTAEASRVWHEVWDLIRLVPDEELKDALAGKSIQMKTAAGWCSSNRCMRFGGLIEKEDLELLGGRERLLVEERVVDEEYHRNDGKVLALLGVTTSPSWEWEYLSSIPSGTDPASEWLTKWMRHWHKHYHSSLGGRPDGNLLRPDGFRMPTGWELLTVLVGDAMQRATNSLCDFLDNNDVGLRPVEFYHATRRQAWTTKDYPHPIWHLLLERGALRVGRQPITFKSLFVSGAERRAALIPSLSQYAKVLAAFDTASASRTSAQAAQTSWDEWFAIAAALTANVQALVPFYELAARDGFVPSFVCSPAGPISIADIVLAQSPADLSIANEAQLQAAVFNLETQKLWLRQGARTMSSEAKIEWHPTDHNSEAVLLADLEPALRDSMREECASSAGVQFVKSLNRTIRGNQSPLEWAIDDNRLLVKEATFIQLTWSDRLKVLFDGATACGWLKSECAFGTLVGNSVDAKRRHIAGHADMASRLLAAVGDPQVICNLFDEKVAMELKKDPKKAAAIAITLMGPALLAEKDIRAAFEREGLAPPPRWGGEAAADFVVSLGFPPEFAISPTRKRDPEIMVSGPVLLKPLHDYQASVVESVDRLLAEPGQRRRAVISLPTGAGKTRVAAQTAVTRVLAPSGVRNRLVVWIAQTDELCEQAVQCFRELWSNLGNRDEALRIIRFWGGQANPQPPEHDEPTLVVASIQTFTVRLSSAPLAWLNSPGLVVIDECHHALTPSYTALLQWLGRTDAPEPPVIGLSATPFRGRNEDETAQLARRFDGRLLPKDQAGLFDFLQREGVLATFDYTRLDMERTFALTESEDQYFRTFNKLPDSALERLGQDNERNDRILTAITTAPEKSALLFATSVEHARNLAANLNLRGVSAAVVSGETDKASRRWFAKAFQTGAVRVLCNHSALTTGFDAPATDLIVIARPVFSPSLYMQMVGRGLRGPKNGGKPQCRILTVQDNLERHSSGLAHHYFEKYYLGQSS